MKKKPYQTVIADPPWAISDKLPGKGRGSAKHYDLLSTQRVASFLEDEGLARLIAPNARLFLWRLASMPHDALIVVEEWGFTPKCELVWRKQTSTGKRWFGMGRTLRAEHETCIIASRGRPEVLSRSVRSVFDAPVLGHSRKPDEFYAIVEELSPGPYLELFARRLRRGWTCLGLEAAGEAEED